MLAIRCYDQFTSSGVAPAVIMYRPDPTPDQESIDIELDDDMRELGFYEIRSGEIIII